MVKKISTVLLCLVLVAAFALSGCKPKETLPEQKITINIGALKGPTSMGLLKLMKNAEGGETFDELNFTLAGAADELSAKFINGEVDVAAVPANLASILYNKLEGDVVVLNINTLSPLYFLENGDTVKSVADLSGKTIYTTGKGTTPEYTLNYILAANNLEAGTDVKVEFVSEAAELGAKMAAGEIKLAFMPEPMVSATIAKNADVRVAFSLTDAWTAAELEGGVVTGVFIVKKEFLEKNEANIVQLLKEYEASINFTQTNTADAAKLCVEYGIIASEAIAAKAIPSCGISFVSGAQMKTTLAAYLEMLYAANNKAVGGKLPGDDFYYTPSEK